MVQLVTNQVYLQQPQIDDFNLFVLFGFLAIIFGSKCNVYTGKSELFQNCNTAKKEKEKRRRTKVTSDLFMIHLYFYARMHILLTILHETSPSEVY